MLQRCLVPAAHHQRERIVPGNGRCSALASSHGPRIQTFALFVGRQDHQHRLRVDRLADHAEGEAGKGLSPPSDEQLRSQKGPPAFGGPSLGRKRAEKQSAS
jgi:hypothetical protein